jgi:hypothetical protein
MLLIDYGQHHQNHLDMVGVGGSNPLSRTNLSLENQFQTLPYYSKYTSPSLNIHNAYKHQTYL